VRAAVAAASLANLFLVRIWVELLGEKTEPAPAIWYGAALATWTLLSLAIWSVAKWTGLPGRLVLAGGGILLIAKELTLASSHEALGWKIAAAGLVEDGFRRGWLVPVAVAIVAGLGALAWRLRLRWISPVLVAVSPIILVTAGHVAWRLALPSPASAMVQKTGSRAARSKGRVVWVVFDELDERVAFSQRPAGLRLPALDTLRAESIVFGEAVSPSNATADSIPVMLGHILERPGLRSGVVGWYIPYCQNYGALLATCEDWPMNRQLNSYGSGFLNVVRNQLRSLTESSLYSVFGQSLAVEAHVRTVLEMEQAASRLAAQSALDLVFLHLPIPHTPFVYRPAEGDLGARNQNVRGYLDNLQLADRTFARIRTSLTTAGLWATTHVIVTGDHGFRRAADLGYPKDDRHVPFIWKPAGEVAPRQISARFETGQSSGLVSRLLDGETAASVLTGYP
jgi:hypothetical protein